MKIVDIAEFYSNQGGGVKTYIHQKMAAAKRAGHDVTILAPGPQTKLEERENGHIWWVKAWQIPVDKRYYLFTKAADAHAILDQIQPDVVEASSTWRGAWIAANWPGKALKSLILHQEPVCVYPHTLLDRAFQPRHIDAAFGWFWAYLRRTQRGFDTSVVSGDWLASRFASFGLQRPQAIPFGIEKDDFSPVKRQEGLRAKILQGLGLDPGTAKLVINVSRHHPEKRLKTVFRAITLANETRPIGLLQIGAGPFTKSIHKAARASKNIALQGFVSTREDLARLLASGDVMLHGGAAETFGIVLAEALCSGLPLVTPDAGGAFDMAGPGHAQIYKTGDAASAAQALLELLARDEASLRAGVKTAASTHVLDHETHFSKLFAHYSALLASSRTGRAG